MQILFINDVIGPIKKRANMRHNYIKLLLCVIVFFFISCTTFASEYPNRPVKLLTMVQRNAQIDLLTQLLSKRLSDELHQPFVVVNRPGGFHGSVMARELQMSKPDGYALGVSATAAFTYAPHSIDTAYSIDDFEFISMLGLNQSGIVTRPDRPWVDLQEAFEWARKQSEPLSYMYQGVDDRDAMQRIADEEGVSLTMMPSIGGPSIIQAVKNDHVDLGHLGAILFDYVKDGRLKLLAASTPQRLTELPDIPTLRELGWDEAVEMFVVLVSPKGVPEDRIVKLEQVMDELAEDEAFQKAISEDLRMRLVPFGIDYAESYMKEANDRFRSQVKEMRQD